MRADDAAPVVAIVGATGYLGRRLVDACLAHGYAVRALVRPDSDVAALRALGGGDGAGPPSSSSSTPRLTIVRCSSAGGLPTPAQLSGTAALLVAVAGRHNRTCSTAEMRGAEVCVPLSLYAAAVAADEPPPRAVFFAPALDAMAASRRGAPPLSEYLTAKADMVAGLRAAEAEAVVRAAAAGARESDGTNSSASTPPSPPPPPPPPPPSPPAVTIVQVAAWGRDVDPIVAALAAAPAWLPAVPAVVVGGGTARLAPLDERDLADRVVAGLACPGDVGASLCLGGPDAVTHAALWRLAGAALGRRVVVVRLPGWAVHRALLPAAAALASATGAPSARAAAYLLRIAADAVGAELVGEERVSNAKVRLADRVAAAAAAVRGGRRLAGR
jgi:nucleoside-diphosphate-sugar epimerase